MGKKCELLIHANEATKLGEKCEKMQNEKLKVFLECTSERLYIETGLRPKTGYYQSEGKPGSQCTPYYNLSHSWKVVLDFLLILELANYTTLKCTAVNNGVS